jgi:glutaminase
MDAAATIAASTLFRGLTPGQCEPFVSIARARELPGGEYVFRLGQEAATLFVVRSGIVELTVPMMMTGDERDVVLEEAHEGDTLAWSALVQPHRFTMSGRARTDVDLLGFARRDLQTMLALQPDAGLRIMSNLAQVIGRRLHVVQTMWNRELQRTVSETFG